MELKHIRMPKDEVAKVEAYRIKHGLSFTMALRVLTSVALEEVETLGRTNAELLLMGKKARCREVSTAALNRGEIEWFPCSVCGSERSQMHHDDYENPLSVTWLCVDHHAKRHWRRTKGSKTK